MTARDTNPRQLRTPISKASCRERVYARRQAVEPERTIGARDSLSRAPTTGPYDVHSCLGKGTAVRADAGSERIELHDPANNRTRLALQQQSSPRKDCCREWEDEPDSTYCLFSFHMMNPSRRRAQALGFPAFSVSGTMKQVAPPYESVNTGYFPVGNRLMPAFAYRRRSPSR